jgi:hypothetical protein
LILQRLNKYENFNPIEGILKWKQEEKRKRINLPFQKLQEIAKELKKLKKKSEIIPKEAEQLHIRNRENKKMGRGRLTPNQRDLKKQKSESRFGEDKKREGFEELGEKLNAFESDHKARRNERGYISTKQNGKMNKNSVSHHLNSKSFCVNSSEDYSHYLELTEHSPTPHPLNLNPSLRKNFNHSSHSHHPFIHTPAPDASFNLNSSQILPPYHRKARSVLNNRDQHQKSLLQPFKPHKSVLNKNTKLSTQSYSSNIPSYFSTQRNHTDNRLTGNTRFLFLFSISDFFSFAWR